MLAPDELSAKAVIPTIRAMVARKLVNEHSLTQQRVASLLGLTQAAVSNYVRQKRGSEFHLDDVDEVNRMVDSMVLELSNGDPRPQVVLKRLTEAGNYVKRNLLMCKWHRELEPTLDLDGCRICATVR
jgi:hypothetical protein